MIYVPSINTVILHIPRTGGTSLIHALTDDPRAEAHEGPPDINHMSASVAKERFPDCHTIAVMRSPWEIVESTYYLCVQLTDQAVSTLWDKSMSFMGLLPFDVWVRHAMFCDWFCVAHTGGFYGLLCDADTEIIQYHRDVNDEVLRRVGLGDVRCGRVMSTRDMERVVWTPECIDAVRHYCQDDIRRFWYEPPRMG